MLVMADNVLAVKVKLLFEPNASYSGHLIFVMNLNSWWPSLLGFPTSPNWGGEKWSNPYALEKAFIVIL